MNDGKEDEIVRETAMWNVDQLFSGYKNKDRFTTDQC